MTFLDTGWEGYLFFCCCWGDPGGQLSLWLPGAGRWRPQPGAERPSPGTPDTVTQAWAERKPGPSLIKTWRQNTSTSYCTVHAHAHAQTPHLHPQTRHTQTPASSTCMEKTDIDTHVCSTRTQTPHTAHASYHTYTLRFLQSPLHLTHTHVHTGILTLHTALDEPRERPLSSLTGAGAEGWGWAVGGGLGGFLRKGLGSEELLAGC